MPIQSVNPATGTLLRRFDPLTPEALGAKLALAASAAATYPAESLDDRAFWMRRLALLLDEDREELAALITVEMGKTLTAARAEVHKCADACRYFAENAATLLAPEHLASAHAESYVRYDPIGVVLAVMPWNFPLWQVFRFLAPALMAGNVGLLKHASNVPQCALAIEALVRRAGFPRGSFQTLLLEAHQVETVLSDARVAAVTVTGSEAAGRAVAAQAGWLLKKTVLELGGCDPFLVLPSADIDAAIAAAVQARILNNGQSCIAAKRFLICGSRYDEFEQRFTAAMAALRVGDPTLADTEVGPLATPQILSTLLAQVHAAVAAGGRLLTGGKRVEGVSGNFFAPAVIADVPRSAPVAREETFGPLALLFRINSLDDAIALANDTPFGLAASAWTTDEAEQQQLTARLQCGFVAFNAPVASDPRLPFGGIRKSGYGRELAAAGMKEFLNAKTVVVGPAAATQPARHPAPAPQAVPPPTPAAQPSAPPKPPFAGEPRLKPVPIQWQGPGEFRLPPLPGFETHPPPQLKPLDTGEFRLPPLPGHGGDHPSPQLKPLDTGEFRLPPLPGVESSSAYDEYGDDDDTPPMRGSVLGLR